MERFNVGKMKKKKEKPKIFAGEPNIAFVKINGVDVKIKELSPRLLSVLLNPEVKTRSSISK